jgi:hypothetical protein
MSPSSTGLGSASGGSFPEPIGADEARAPTSGHEGSVKFGGDSSAIGQVTMLGA